MYLKKKVLSADLMKKMSVIIASLMCFTLLFAIEVQAQTVTRNSIGTHGGYDYEFWVDSGSGTMTLKDGGAFDCQWSNINNILFRKGKKYNETQTHQQIGNITIQYGVDYNPSGNSYLCVYGWTVDPLVEYYIVDSWGSWRPPGSTSRGQVTIDGGTYDIYQTTRTQQPSIKGTATFQQYWSVRTSKKTSGTISVSQHFAAWERMNMRMGKMYEVALTIEGYQSSGRANVHTNILTVGGTTPTNPQNPTTPTPTQGPTGPATRSAFDRIEAEEYNSINGSNIEVVGTANSGSGLGYIENGNSVTYSGINFGTGATRFTANVASNADTPTNIDIRLNSATGTRLGTLSVPSTGGWNEYSQLSTNISSVTGSNNIVLVFSGPVNIDWFTFTAGTVAPTATPTPTQRPTTAPTQSPTVKYGDLNGDGLIDSSDYILLRRFILQVTTTLPNRTSADLNGDGNIDSSDVILLRRFILEIIDKFPVEGMVTPTPTAATTSTPTPTPTPTQTTPSGRVETSVSTTNIQVPSFQSLQNNTRLPDPFKFLNGTTMTTRDQWPQRRAEISALAQAYIYGTKPPKPASVTGSFSSNRITVTVSEGGKSISFNCSIQYPSTGSAPYPAIIGVGMNTLNTREILNLGVALITFPSDEIAQQSGMQTRGRGKFYDLYGSNHSAGALMGWAWGVSRLIDALEVTPAARIDATKLGVTGGSRLGKGALAVGAFDERIALTIPQESGSGGTSSWRVAEAQKASGQNVQTLSHIIGEQPWLSKSLDQFVNQVNKLPVDQHSVLAMVAPRGLLIIENTGMEWLGNVSCYTSAQAARIVYESLGVKDHLGFSQVGGHQHCQFPDSQIPELRAFIQKFLLGNNSANTDINKTDGRFTFDRARWVDWTVPTLR